MRASGILLPVSSIPSDYGIGAFSEEAYEFVRQLERAGQRYWQILPMGPTGYGDSPYQSFSTFAGNPYFIDLKEWIKKGWLKKKECKELDFGNDLTCVDYAKLYESRPVVFKKAFERSGISKSESFRNFCRENAYWLDDYALYTELKAFYGGKSWSEWGDKFRMRDAEALAAFAEEHADSLCFQKFLQYEFYEQWNRLKSYANEHGVEIIGDIPIYVAFDSADSWASPELFQFDENSMPVKVAGCPPDAFCETGQLWGNPLYDWAYHKETGYLWWLKRISHCSSLYDIIRIDHFRGFDEYYAIPYGDPTAEFGEWEQGPGMDLFRRMTKRLGDVRIIAEDLGFLTESVLQMVKESGYPGMKVLEFAFEPDEPSDYLPYNHEKNCVVYTGTHDNETLAGWYKGLDKRHKKYIRNYLGNQKLSAKETVWEIIRLAQSSTADTCIIPIQDYLGLDNSARINRPSTLGGNWMWRLDKDAISDELLKKIRKMTRIYGRTAIK